MPLTKQDLDNIKTVLSPEFNKIHSKLAEHDQKFIQIDKKFDGIDKRLDDIDVRLDGIDKRLDGIEETLEENGRDHTLIFDLIKQNQIYISKYFNHEIRIQKLEKHVFDEVYTWIQIPDR